MVDCVTESAGCDGGWPADVFDYAMNNNLASDCQYEYKFTENPTCLVPDEVNAKGEKILDYA